MTDSAKTISDSIADKPADAPVSPSKVPADSTKPADASPSEQKSTTTPDVVKKFAQLLTGAGYITTIRKTRGDDIDAACGQLAGEVQDRTDAAARMQERRTIMLQQE